MKKINKYLLFAVALFSLFVVNTKATTIETDEFYLSNLKYAGTTLNTFSNFATSGGQNQKFSFGLVPYGYEAGTNLFISIVICTDFDFGGQGYGDAGLSNFQVYKSDYTCSFNGSSYTGGRIRIVGLNLKTGGGNEFSGGFYLWQMTSGSISLIDFKVSANGFVDIKDYAQQSVIDGQKNQTNEQKKTNDKLDEAENTRKGILGTIKDVLSNIINLPKKIVEFLIDALKSLFVPTDKQLYEIVNDSKELSENFGFVGQSMSFFINIFTSLLGMVNANGCIEMPAFKIGATSLFDEHIFWDARNVCLADNLILNANINTIRTITSIVFVSLFVGFATRKFFSILSKSENEVNSE